MVGVSDIFSQIGLNLPEGLGGTASSFAQGIIFFLVAGLVVGITTYIIFNRKQYNKRIHIFEEINGQAIPVGYDRAKEIILPNTSIRAIFLMKRKVYLPRPSIQMQKGHYWYFIRKDGEWINLGLTNLNEELDELKIHYDHTDMRMANASLKKLIEKNYKKLNWAKEYAPYIAMGVLIFILAVSSFLILSQAKKNLGGMENAAETTAEVAKSLENILSSMDNICSSSGVRTVYGSNT